MQEHTFLIKTGEFVKLDCGFFDTKKDDVLIRCKCSSQTYWVWLFQFNTRIAFSSVHDAVFTGACYKRPREIDMLPPKTQRDIFRSLNNAIDYLDEIGLLGTKGDPS